VVIQAYAKSGLEDVGADDVEKIRIPKRPPNSDPKPLADPSAAEASSTASDASTEAATSMANTAPTVDPLVTGDGSGAETAGGTESLGGLAEAGGLIGAILTPVLIALGAILGTATDAQ